MTSTPKPGAVIKPTTPPPFQIRSKQQREKERYLKMLVYGDYGVGKTFLAGTAAGVASMRDVIAVAAEAGELTWDTAEQKYGFDNIDSVRVTDYKQVAKVYDFLKLHCSLRDKDDPESVQKLKNLQSQLTGVPVEEIDTPRRYRTAIIDSLTEVEVYCMNQLLGISDRTGMSEETQSAEWSEYKKQHSMVQRLVRAYRDLPMHVILVCSRSYIQDDQKRMLFSPQMTGKLSSQVQGFMDIVGYLNAAPTAEGDEKTMTRRMYVQPVGRYAAKCRLSNYKKTYWDNPTMEGILKDVGML